MNRLHAAALALTVLIAGCAMMGTSAPAPDYHAIVASADRSPEDRKTDERRKPELLLAFTGARPGMRVLDMGAGAGYSTELLARAVAPNGIVYAQNSKEVLERIVKTKFDDRFAHSSLKNVVKVVRDADDPTPPDARDLDLVTMFLTYHDLTFMGVDRPRMLKSLYAALKPGGTLVVIDHAAAPGGVPAEVGKTLHRIDEHLLESEVEAAGFKLVEESNFLRNPQDPKDAPFFKMTTPTDQFALKFRRP